MLYSVRCVSDHSKKHNCCDNHAKLVTNFIILKSCVKSYSTALFPNMAQMSLVRKFAETAKIHSIWLLQASLIAPSASCMISTRRKVNDPKKGLETMSKGRCNCFVLEPKPREKWQNVNANASPHLPMGRLTRARWNMSSQRIPWQFKIIVLVSYHEFHKLSLGHVFWIFSFEDFLWQNIYSIMP